MVEDLQFLFYATAAAAQLLIVLGLAGRRPRGRRRFFQILLLLMFLFVAMEEVSWGQRLFHWDTPPFLEDLNLQGETNIHNIFGDALSPFHIGLMLFINGFCYLLPLADHLSDRIHTTIGRIGLPVIGIDMVALFIIADLVRPLAISRLDAQITVLISLLPLLLYVSGRTPRLFGGVEAPGFQVTSIFLVGMASLLLALTGYRVPRLWLWESREVLFGLAFLSYSLYSCHGQD